MIKIKKTISIVLIATSLVGIAAFSFPSGTAAAQNQQEKTPTVTVEPSEEQVKIRLEKQYDRLQGGLVKQADRISKLDDVVQKTQGLIDKLKEKNLDTTTLEQALKVFVSKITKIQAAHEEANAILSRHHGFSVDGSVTIIEDAHSTLENSRNALEDARKLMQNSSDDLQAALRDFRSSNPPPGDSTESVSGD